MTKKFHIFRRSHPNRPEEHHIVGYHDGKNLKIVGHNAERTPYSLSNFAFSHDFRHDFTKKYGSGHQAADRHLRDVLSKARDSKHAAGLMNRSGLGNDDWVAHEEKSVKEGIMSFREFREASTIEEGWLRHKDGGYSADAAAIDAHHREHGSVRCPKCRQPIDPKKFKAHRDREGDTAMLTHRHDCGAHMTVYND